MHIDAMGLLAGVRERLRKLRLCAYAGTMLQSARLLGVLDAANEHSHACRRFADSHCPALRLRFQTAFESFALSSPRLSLSSELVPRLLLSHGRRHLGSQRGILGSCHAVPSLVQLSLNDGFRFL